MAPILCVIGGCNGADKTTLASELLPRMRLMRFLNADEIARGLSPLDPSLSAFKAGRLVIEETRGMLSAGTSFAVESTLSGKTHVALLRRAKEQGYRSVLHYIVIASVDQAIERVRLRARMAGHDVPATDVTRRYERSHRHFLHDYLPLADEWDVWENSNPPARHIASSATHSVDQIIPLLHPTTLMESKPAEPDAMRAMVIEASRVATEKMLDQYKRMGIKVTPQMTLAPEPPERKPAGKAKKP